MTLTTTIMKKKSVAATLVVATAIVTSANAHAGLVTPEELGIPAQITAAPFALSALGNAKAASASPETLARSFLSQNAVKLNLNAELSDLVLTSIQNAPVGTIVRFVQTVGGTQVQNADVVITVADSQVVSILNNTVKTYASKQGAPRASLSVEWAQKKAYEELALTASPAYEKIIQKVAVINGEARPAYFVSLSAPVDRKYGWEILLDADSGAVLQSRDVTVHAVSANVFEPNPTLKSGHTYGAVDGYIDNNNADSAFFDSMMTSVQLDNVIQENGHYVLAGPNVVIADIEAPTNAPNCDSASGNGSFSFTRNDPCFDAVSAYYFIDKELKYLNGTLGFNAHPLAYSGGIKVDPQGVYGDDNSHYVPTADYLAFGEGGVDDAQDHDVVIHEFGHAIHNWLTNGHMSQAEGLSEGIGDYWAASHDREYTQPGQVYRDWTFSYDGHNPFWPGRVVNVSGTYPSAAQGEIHDAGQLWATVCIEILDAIGKQKADKAFWSGIAQLTDNSNQNDAAKAYVAAAKKLYGNDQNLVNTVIAKFKARGYQI